MYKILVMGYDERSIFLYRRLEADYNISADFYEPDNFDFNKIKDVEYNLIILPIPTRLSKDNFLSGYDINLVDILKNWDKSKYVYATIDKNPVLRNVQGISLLEDEYFVLKNAYLTAKAAIQIACEENDLTEKVCMVAGYGRIGRYICKLLKSRGCKIVLATGSHKLSEFYKCIGYNDISTHLDDCGIIFNTAPYNYFTYRQLDDYNGRYLELASKPYGFEYDGINMPVSVTMCPSLPGKYYPSEAAEIIYDSFSVLLEKG